jgi:hypothetical protein
METARESLMRHAKLDIRSGQGQLLQMATARPSAMTTTTVRAPNKIGTWVTFEIGPLPSV